MSDTDRPLANGLTYAELGVKVQEAKDAGDTDAADVPLD